MQINYYKTYIQTIKNAIWTTMFQEFYIDEKDILNKWAVGCAYFVSNVLKQFNLTSVWRANVEKIVSDLETKGRTHLDPTMPPQDIPVGSIIIREAHHGETYDKMHKHIGFYIWDEQAVSNNSIHFTGMRDAWYVPVQHHYTYEGTRPITAILTRDRNDPFSDRLYHYEIDIDCISSIWEENLRSQWLSDEEIFFRSWKDDWLQNGRLCWVACVLMALWFFWKSDETGGKPTFKNAIQYANSPITYTNAQTGEQKTVPCFTKETWRYHSWLVHIAEQLASQNWFSIKGSIGDFSKKTFLSLTQDLLRKNNNWEKKVMITSVTALFDTKKEKKWGHLVIVAWLDFNGHETSVIVCDPLETQKKQLPLETFLDSCSGKYFIIGTEEK